MSRQLINVMTFDFSYRTTSTILLLLSAIWLMTTCPIELPLNRRDGLICFFTLIDQTINFAEIIQLILDKF